MGSYKAAPKQLPHKAKPPQKVRPPVPVFTPVIDVEIDNDIPGQSGQWNMDTTPVGPLVWTHLYNHEGFKASQPHGSDNLGGESASHALDTPWVSGWPDYKGIPRKDDARMALADWTNTGRCT